MTGITRLAVGEPYPYQLLEYDGAVFDWTAGGLDLRLFFDRPSDTEMTAVRRAAVCLGFLTDNAVMCIYWKFGASLDGEAFFHVSRYAQEGRGELQPAVPSLPTEQSRLTINVTLIDRSSRKVKGLRNLSLTPAQSQFLARQLQRQLDNPIDAVTYDECCERYMQRFPSSSAMATVAHCYDQLGQD